MSKMSDLKSEYIDSPGYYDVTVTGHKLISNQNTGNPGVQFEVATDSLARSNVTCWLTHKALFKLAQFASHCGIDDSEIDKAYCINNGDLPEPNQQGHVIFPDACHKVFHGRKVRVKVEKDGQYHNITGTMPANGPLPQMATPQSVEETPKQNETADLPF